MDNDNERLRRMGLNIPKDESEENTTFLNLLSYYRGWNIMDTSETRANEDNISTATREDLQEHIRRDRMNHPFYEPPGRHPWPWQFIYEPPGRNEISSGLEEWNREYTRRIAPVWHFHWNFNEEGENNE